MKVISFANLRIPPPLVTALFGGLMWVSDFFYPINLVVGVETWIITLLLLSSFFLLLPAIVQFYKSKTTVNPLNPEKTKVLVIKGVYRFSRNPMYLGMALVLLAWAVFLANPLNIVSFCGFILFMNYFQIRREEQALEKIFGEDFKRYCMNVRRWI